MGYRKVLVGTDGSDSATVAVHEAAKLARALEARLEIVYAFHPPDPRMLARWMQEAPEEIASRITGTAGAETVVEKAKAAAAEEGVEAEARFLEGDPAEVIIDEAEGGGADLIIVGSRGMTGAKRFLLGSVPNKISHHAPCDVLIVHTT